MKISSDREDDYRVRRILKGISWLRAVPSETLDRLADQSVLHRVPPGCLLFEQAEIPTFAQFLLSGSIELLGLRGRDETLVELLQPVDMVIPAAVLTNQPYLMRARVYEEAQILLIRAETFRAAVASDLMLSQATLDCLASQFRRQVRQAKNMKLRTAEERVGCYLVALLDRADADRTDAGGTVRLPLEKRLIASQLGMTRETFSRCLSGMARFGMRIHGDVLLVEDEAAARARFPLDPLIDGAESIPSP